MSISEKVPAELSEAAETLRRIEKHFAEEERAAQLVDEAIQRAMRKSRYVIRDPGWCRSVARASCPTNPDHHDTCTL